MEIVQLLVAPYGVHIGVESGSRLEVVFSQSHPLPFSQRLDDLYLFFSHVLYCEADGPLDAVEVIIEPRLRSHEQRSRYSSQPQAVSQLLLEKILYLFYCPLTLHVVYKRRVIFRYYEFVHISPPLHVLNIYNRSNSACTVRIFSKAPQSV